MAKIQCQDRGIGAGGIFMIVNNCESLFGLDAGGASLALLDMTIRNSVKSSFEQLTPSLSKYFFWKRSPCNKINTSIFLKHEVPTLLLSLYTK